MTNEMRNDRNIYSFILILSKRSSGNFGLLDDKFIKTIAYLHSYN